MIKKSVLLLFITGALLGSFQESTTAQKLDLIEVSPSVVTTIKKISVDGSEINNYIAHRMIAVDRALSKKELQDDFCKVFQVAKFRMPKLTPTGFFAFLERVERDAMMVWYLKHIIDKPTRAILDEEFTEEKLKNNIGDAVMWQWFSTHFAQKFSALIDEYKANLARQDREERMACNLLSLLGEVPQNSMTLKNLPSLAKSRESIFD